jgi:glycosyltransferase involved in cell wall biosynthesis
MTDNISPPERPAAAIMRILVVNYEFPPVGGGGGRASADISRFLAGIGHQVRVHTALVRGLPRVEDRDGYRIFRHPSLRRARERCSVPEMCWFVLLNIIPLIRHIREWKPDAVHLHFAVPTGILGPILTALTKTPYILTVHLGDVPGGVPEQTDLMFRMIKPLTVPIWRRAAAVTAVSAYVRDLALASYPGIPIRVINNGISLKTQSREAPAGRTDVARLIFAGRLSVQKNPVFMIDLLDRVSDLPWRMDIVGDGPLLAAVERRIRERGLGSRITLHGWQSQEYVEKCLGESDVLLLPSHCEGFSIVALQALAAGVAIIAAATGGNADIVQDEVNGFLCPVDAPDLFAQRLRALLTSKNRLDSMKAASLKSAARFDLTLIGKEYECLFREVIRRGAGR